MKKPRVLDRFTALGRLRRKLAEIQERVRSMALSRMDGGDAIQRKVMTPLTPPRTKAQRELVVLAGLQRASFYQQSGGATALEAAEALLAAHGHHCALTENPARARLFLTPAGAILDDLAELGSRRTRYRMAEIFLEAAVEAGTRELVIRRALPRMPEILRGALACGTDAKRLARSLAHCARLLPCGSRDLPATRRELFALALKQQEPSVALALFKPEAGQDQPDLVRLATLAARRGLATRRAASFYEYLLETHPECAKGLEAILKHPALVADDPHAGILKSKRQINTFLRKVYRQSAWPCRNLAVVAAWEGRPQEFLARLVEAWQRGWRPKGVSPTLLIDLWALGFQGAVRKLLRRVPPGAPARSLLTALMEAEEGLFCRSAEDCLALEQILTARLSGHPLTLAAVTRVQLLRARLNARGGRWRKSLELLELSLAQDPDQRGARLERARLLIREGRLEQVREQIEGLEARHKSRETLALKAALYEAEGALTLAQGELELATQAPPEAAFEAVWRARLLQAASGLCGGRDQAASVGPKLLTLLWLDARPEALEEAGREEIYRRAAALARRTGDEALRLRSLRKLAERKGCDRDTLLQAVRALLRGGEEKQARRHLQRLLRRNWGDGDALSLMGLLALRAGRFRDAANFLGRCAAPGDAGPGTLLALALVEARAGRFKEALERLQSLPENLPAALAARARYLKGALHERQEELVPAFQCYRGSLLHGEWPLAREACGRLSIFMGHQMRQRGGGGGEDFLEAGCELLRGTEGQTNRHYADLGALLLGRGSLTTGVGEPLRESESTEDLSELAAVVHREMIRAGLRSGDMALASRLARKLPGGAGEALRQQVHRYQAFWKLEHLNLEARPEELSRLAANLAELPPTLEVQLALEFIEALGGPPLKERVPAPEGSPGLALATARAHLCRGRNLDRVRLLVEPLLPLATPHGAQARLILAHLEPDRVEPGLLQVFDLLDGDLPGLMTRAEALGLVARMAYLGQAEGVLEESFFPHPSALHAQVLAARVLERTHQFLTSKGHHRELLAGIQEATRLLQEGSPAREALTRSEAQLQALLAAPTRARVASLLRGGDLPLALEVAEDLVRLREDPAALHLVALIRHRQAFQRELAGDPASPAAFAAAHRAFEQFLAHERALEHLCGPHLPRQVLQEAVVRLRHHLAAIHILLAAQHARQRNAEGAAAHGRLVLASELRVPHRERLRTALREALREGRDAPAQALEAAPAKARSKSPRFPPGLEEMQTAGAGREAEELLLIAYEEATQAGDLVRARQVIDLLHDLRGRQAVARLERTRERVRQALARESFREALNLLACAEVEPALDGSLLALRVRARLGAGRLAQARDDLVRLEGIHKEGHSSNGELEELREAVSTAAATARLGSTYRAALEAFQGQRPEHALELLSKLAAEHPGEPMVAWLRAMALMQAGMGCDARLAAREALAGAKGDHSSPECRLVRTLIQHLDKEQR